MRDVRKVDSTCDEIGTDEPVVEKGQFGVGATAAASSHLNLALFEAGEDPRPLTRRQLGRVRLDNNLLDLLSILGRIGASLLEELDELGESSSCLHRFGETQGRGEREGVEEMEEIERLVGRGREDHVLLQYEQGIRERTQRGAGGKHTLS